ncbi:MAG: tetratricopeptide repeat protein [Planctomycetes bacterium]|nr:tetratricopeptide repeat protein [Planctomycetota bacterium]
MLDGLLLRVVWLATRLLRFLLVPLRHPLVWIPASLGAIAAVAWGLEQGQRWWWQLLPEVPVPWPLLDATYVLGAFALIVVAVAVWSARRRLVVGAIAAIDDDQAAFGKGLGGLIAAQLIELRDLFTQFDEHRARGAEQAVLIEAPLPTLQEAISSQATLGLGPFQVPVGVLAGLFGRLVRGPRISGQVGKDGAARVIALELHGVARTRSWVVSAPMEHAGEPSRSQQDLAQELACRIFAAIALPAEVQWRALQHFVAGLRAFRRAQHAPQDRRANLREAERHLVAAVTTDDRLDVGWHNLGVVYTELGRLEAAQQAFARSNTAPGGHWRLLYPMAWNQWQQALAIAAAHPTVAVAQLQQAGDLVAQARLVAPSTFQHALTWNLAGLVAHDRWQIERDVMVLAEGAVAFRKAVRLAWWAMCGALLAGADSAAARLRREQTRDHAAATLRNIAFLYVLAAKDPTASRWIRWLAALRARRSLLLVRALAPWIVDTHETLALLAGDARQWGRARRHAAAAVTHAAGDPDRRCTLALAEAHRDRLDAALRSCQRAADRVGELGVGARARVLEALRVLTVRIGAIRTAIAPSTRARARKAPVALAWALAGHRLLGYGAVLEQLRAWQAEPSKAEPLLQQLEQAVAAVRERLERFPEIEARRAELHRQGAVGIAAFEAFVQQRETAGMPWEAAIANEGLARVLLDAGRPKDAEVRLRQAIDWFGRVHREQVRKRGLQGLLARALRWQNRLADALEAAQAGVDEDPLSSYDYRELGEAHMALAQWEGAVPAFTSALRFAPDDADLHRFLGQCLLRRTRAPDERAQRRQDLAQAIDHLQTALEVGKSPAFLRFTEHLLARVLAAAQRDAEAIAHLRVLERRQYCLTAIRLHLADCLLTTHAWQEAEERFVALAAELAPKDAAEANAMIDGGADDDVPRGIAAAYAYLGLASTLIDRRIAAADALAAVDQAEGCLRDLTDAKLKRTWIGNCARFRGRAQLVSGDHEAACRSLESAARADPRPEVFVNLSAAVAHRAAAHAAGSSRDEGFAAAREHLAQARRLDIDGVCERELAEAQRLLEALEPKLPVPVPPAA